MLPKEEREQRVNHFTAGIVEQADDAQSDDSFRQSLFRRRQPGSPPPILISNSPAQPASNASSAVSIDEFSLLWICSHPPQVGGQDICCSLFAFHHSLLAIHRRFRLGEKPRPPNLSTDELTQLTTQNAQPNLGRVFSVEADIFFAQIACPDLSLIHI